MIRTRPAPPTTPPHPMKPPSGVPQPTLWDRYALAAISGAARMQPHDPAPDGMARRAADIADAMMAERAKRGIAQ